MKKFKIGMVGGWNTNSGASFHAELIGRAWVEMGHKLTVFTFYDYAFHGTVLTAPDEDYVIRCYTVSSYKPVKFDPKPFFMHDYEIFVVQDFGMLPKDELAKIFITIREKAKTVNVIHHGDIFEDASYYQFEFDAIVCFDERYKNFLKKIYPEDKIHIIPYPSYPVVKGDKDKARATLNLPKDKKIILSFGPAARQIIEVIPAIAELKKEYPLLLLVVTKEEAALKEFKKIKDSKIIDIELREEAPELKRLYDYLYAADLLLFNKPKVNKIVVSSTAFQCMGSLCPIVARSSEFVEYYDKEVMKYETEEELKRNIRNIFDQTKEYKIMMKAAEDYVNNNCDKAVAKKYIKLFNYLLKMK